METQAFAILSPLVVAVTCALSALNGANAQEAKPFQEALVLSGGGANWPVFIGALDGFKKAGHDPDLLVGVCGGSIAAAIAYAEPNRDFSKSENTPEGFEFSRKIKIKDPLLPGYLGFFTSFKSWIKNDEVAGIMAPTVLKIPDLNLVPLFAQKFTPSGKRRLMILATRLLYDPIALEKDLARRRSEALDNDTEMPSRPKRAGRKLFRLTIFTDSATAKLLREAIAAQRLRSKPAALFPAAALDEGVDIVDTATIGDAVRASISDPLLTTPAKIGDSYYMTGATDNYPIEMVSTIASKISHTIWSGLPSWQDQIFQSVFKFSSNELIEKSDLEKVNQWIELGPLPHAVQKMSMNPAVTAFGFQSRFPRTMADYDKHYSVYYQYGYDRGLAGGKKPEFSENPRHLLRQMSEPNARH
jgi:predicted acylesterase/phospholipase RssA